MTQICADLIGHLHQLFLLSPDMLCVAEPQGRLLHVNPAWEKTLGWTADEITAVPYLHFVHPEDLEATKREAVRLFEGHTTLQFENRYRCKDGSYRWLQWNAASVPELGVIYSAARDVTEQKEAQHEVAAARLEAERATRAKNEFLSHVSHDLRTPLNAILGFAQILELDNLTVDQHDHVRHILVGGKHLLELITEVIDITRIESGRLSLSLEPVSVREAVERAVDLIRPLAVQRNLVMEVERSAEDDPAVLADRQRLHQILLNFLSNAIKYNRPGGRVTVAAAPAAHHRYRIAVRDTGSGIAPEKVALLFQPFERLGAEQTAIEGTGLGLALCRALADAMGGTVGVEAVMDQGSVFWVDLTRAAPAGVVAVGEDQPRRIERSIDVSRTASVVYIEDNVSNVRLMERVLQRRPRIQLLHAPQGDAGLALIEARRPDMVILDLHLPDMSGEEILSRLWENPSTRGLPVLMLTADATPGLFRRLKAAGAARCLTKPLDLHEVLEAVDDLLSGTGDADAHA